MAKVSVILPIFNVENYLREAGFDRSGVEVLVAKRDTPSVDFSI